MGFRAYLLIDVHDDNDREEFVRAMRTLEEDHAIEFVDTVIGSCDMVAMVEASDGLDAVLSRIRAYQWTKQVEVLRVVSIYERRSVKPNFLRSIVSNRLKTG
ncbi:MAG: hypothetical protein Q8J63_08280 [Candidatus Aquicultor sp.]|nr:hypothetical protein [Candidatus Aquicultor sp.]